MKKQIKKFEIKLFDELAKQGDYHLSDEDFYDYVKKHLIDNGITLRGRVLEAGCGSGVIGKAMQKRFPKIEVIGVDISPKMILQANKNRDAKYRAIVGDLENIKLFEAKSFDVILCSLVLHHFPSINKLFENFDRWIRKNGTIIIIEPNSRNLVARLSYLVRMIVESVVGKEYLLRTKMATPNEINHPLESYLYSLKKNNFKVISSTYFFDEPDLKIDLSLGGLKTLALRMLHKLFPGHKFTQSNIFVIAKR